MKRANQTHGSRILGTIFCRLLLGGNLWAVKCYPKPGYSLNTGFWYPKCTSVAVISDIFPMLAYLWKFLEPIERNTVSRRWTIHRSQESMEQRRFWFAFNAQGWCQGKFMLLFVGSCDQKSKEQGKDTLKSKNVHMEDSMGSKPISTSVAPEMHSSVPTVPTLPYVALRKLELDRKWVNECSSEVS